MSIFMENKYTRWYYSIINNAQTRTTLEYSEKHHIIPKSLGGTNHKNNLVILTAREHFICHWLLTKMTNSKKMQHAFWRMLVKGNDFQDRYIPNSQTYSSLRKKFGSFNKGKPMSDESKLKLSKSRKGQPAWNKGKPRTPEEKQAISLACKAAIKPPRKPHTKETLSKLSIAASTRKKIVCEHCGVSSQPANYKRWHGNNCKLHPSHPSSC